jgi:competence protein ComFC
MTIGTVEIHPISLKSPHWSWGWALDVHTVSSIPIGDDAFGHMQYDTTRSVIGEMMYQLKYRNDHAQVQRIAGVAAEYLRRTFLQRRPLHRIVPAPPSQIRAHQPVFLLADALGSRLNIPVLRSAVQRVSPTSAAKNTDDIDQRRRDQRDAFAMGPDTDVSGAVILLFDDLYQSGATAGSVARVLKAHGNVAEVCFLSITKTRR